MKDRYEGIDEFIIAVIKKETAKLLGRHGITIEDKEDIEQDLHFQVWKKVAGSFAPADKNYRAAIRRIVDSRIKDMIEHRDAERRKPERDAVRLNDPVSDEDTSGEDELADMLDLRGVMEWHRRRHRKIDLQTALSELPGELRMLASAIDELRGNLTAVATELGLSRKKARHGLGKLRQLLGELRGD